MAAAQAQADAAEADAIGVYLRLFRAGDSAA
jgi:hypothetical protein